MPDFERSLAEPVPSVDFYGKADAWPTSARLYSEELVERSARHDWVIRAHRHDNLMQIFLLLDGGGAAKLDSVRHLVQAPCLLVIPERCVHEFEWTNDSRGYVLSIAVPLIGKLRRKIGGFAEVLTTPAVHTLHGDGLRLTRIIECIHAEYGRDDPLRDLSLETQLIEMSVCLARNAKADSQATTKSGRGRRHYRRFVDLVEIHHKDQWSVSHYADLLGVTPPHLNAICKKYGGRSALNFIHDRVLLAARRGLAYTDNSVADVARSLGFADPSYFTRFFKRFEGRTPSRFRRETGTQSAGRR